MKKLMLFRFSVFWIWVLTLAISLTVFIWKMNDASMIFSEIEESLTKVISLLLPQISIMLAFFFRTSKERQQQLIVAEQALAGLAVGLSLFYHLTFWIFLVLSVGLGRFGETIDINTNALIKIMNLLSIFGLYPIAYLFATGKLKVK